MAATTTATARRPRLYEHRVNGWVVIGVHGEVNAETVAHLSVRLRSLARTAHAPVAVDLTAVRAPAAARLDTLLDQGRGLTRAGRRFALIVDPADAAAPVVDAEGDLLRVDAVSALPPAAASRFARSA